MKFIILIIFALVLAIRADEVEEVPQQIPIEEEKSPDWRCDVVGGNRWCHFWCVRQGHPGGVCNWRGECDCLQPTVDEPPEKIPVEEEEPADHHHICQKGGNRWCHVWCHHHGHTTGWCNERDECECMNPRAEEVPVEDEKIPVEEEDKPADHHHICHIGGDRWCHFYCVHHGHGSGWCNERDECLCVDPKAEEVPENIPVEDEKLPVEEDKPSDHHHICHKGGDRWCHLWCVHHGHGTGWCNERDECLCVDPDAEEAPEIQENKQKGHTVCEIGGNRWCRIHCIREGFRGGHCNDEDECLCQW